MKHLKMLAKRTSTLIKTAVCESTLLSLAEFKGFIIKIIFIIKWNGVVRRGEEGWWFRSLAKTADHLFLFPLFSPLPSTTSVTAVRYLAHTCLPTLFAQIATTPSPPPPAPAAFSFTASTLTATIPAAFIHSSTNPGCDVVKFWASLEALPLRPPDTGPVLTEAAS